MAPELQIPPFEQPRQDLSDTLTLLTDVDDHLEYLDRVFHSLENAEELHRRLAPRLEAIRRRRENPIFSLAIVGEFSSGKSTFINGLLGDDLLASSSLASTAAVTRIAHGHELKIEPRYLAGAEGDSSNHDGGRDPRELLRYLTTDDATARRLESVTIRHPAAFLRDGLELLDTPGINSNRAQHAGATVKALEHRADAAVVLIAADRQLTMTLASFLRGPLEPFLHRCAFIITKMDHVRRRDRQAVIDEIRHRLGDQLGLEQAPIFAAAPKVRLDALHGEEGREHTEWLARFSALEAELDLHVRKARAVSLAESVIRLLRHSMEDLDEHLRDLWQAYQQRVAKLERETIRDLDAFGDDLRQDHQSRVAELAGQAAAQLAEIFPARRQQLRQTVRAALDRAATAEQLTEAAERWVPGILESATIGHRQDCERSLHKIDRGTHGLLSALEQRFLTEYQKLASVDRVASLPGAEPPDVSDRLQSTIERVCERLQKIGLEFSQTAKHRRDLKRAAVLSFFVPCVGPIVAPILLILAIRLPSGPPNRLRELYWQALELQLDQLSGQLDQAARSALDACRQAASETLEAQLAEYLSRYRQVVDQMVEAQQAQLTRGRQIQIRIDEERAEIDRRCKLLVSRQERLRATPTLPQLFDAPSVDDFESLSPGG